MKEFRNPEDIHPPLAAYAHQVEVSGGERLLVMSGQVGMTPGGSVPDGALDQLDVALENVRSNLEAAGMDLDDLIKLTFYVAGEMDAVRRRQIVASKLRDHRPCMTLLFVSSLASPALKVEIDAWASSGGR